MAGLSNSEFAPVANWEVVGKKGNGTTWILVQTMDSKGVSFEYAMDTSVYWADIRGFIKNDECVSADQISRWIRDDVHFKFY